VTTAALRREVFAGPAPRAFREAPAALPGRPLAILHLITRLDRGGSSDCTLLQAIGAAERGHRVTVLSGPAASPTRLLARAGAQRRLRLLALPSLAREVSPLHDLRALFQITAHLRAERYDIVHTHTSKAGALGRVAALLCGRRPIVVHQPHGHLFYGYYGKVATALLIRAERLLAPLAHVLVALSFRGAEEHLSRRVGRPGQFRVVRSGIDLRAFRRAPAERGAARNRLGYGEQDLVVGSLCRLEPIKGVEDLLRGFLIACRRRPRLRLFIGGGGPLRERLLETARAAGAAGRVTIAADWVAPEEVLPALDLFVLASRNEGMGRALVEAMAARLPVIACAVGGVPEVLEEGRDGLLIPPADAEAIALAIGRLADDPRLRSELAARARGRSVAFGAGRMVRTLLRLYLEALR